MHLRTKLALLAVMVIGILPTAANAYACDSGHHDHSGVAAASYTMEKHHGYGLLHASAVYLGTTTQQLKSQLVSGKSLADVADATSGKSATGLVDYLTGLVKTKIDNLQSTGKVHVTSAQESAFLDRVQAKLTKLVNFTWTGRMDWHH